jgi:hypothetical protein
MSNCTKSEAVRDYAFKELPAGERREMEQHLSLCPECAADLDQLQATTAALLSLEDKEIPQRIAFVSDKVFEPSLMARFFRSSWAGFASAGVMAVALALTAWHKPAEVRTIVVARDADYSKKIDDAIAKAVRQVRDEDARTTKALLDAAELKHEREHSVLIATIRENIEVMEKRAGWMTSLASLEATATRGGQ